MDKIEARKIINEAYSALLACEGDRQYIEAKAILAGEKIVRLSNSTGLRSTFELINTEAVEVTAIAIVGTVLRTRVPVYEKVGLGKKAATVLRGI